jgi:hypothetical protein
VATVKWAAAPTDRGTVLTTELNTLTDTSYCAPGTAYDNTANLDRWGWVEFTSGGSLTPTTGAMLTIFMLHSPGGTNYDDGPNTSGTNPGTHDIVGTIALTASANNPRRGITLYPFPLPPGKVKFALKNDCGATLPGSGNTLRLWTSNEAIA